MLLLKQRRLDTLGTLAAGCYRKLVRESDVTVDRNDADGAGDAIGTVAAFDQPSSQAMAASEPFVGRWNRLVSTTNWEKGRIICQWRQALMAAGAPPADYTDETWAGLVGGVTGQHVGRLRRVYERFGSSQEKFPGLYWSHFQAALDWDDAEMWLEGAVQAGWSVARMRQMRWETLGRFEGERPRHEELIAEELDGDSQPPRERSQPATISGTYAEVQGPRHEGPDFGGGEPADFSRGGEEAHERAAASAGAPAELVQPFAALPTLPDDLAEAFEAFKLAVLRHKTGRWAEVSAGDVLRVLDALKALVLAPATDDAPF